MKSKFDILAASQRVSILSIYSFSQQATWLQAEGQGQGQELGLSFWNSSFHNLDLIQFQNKAAWFVHLATLHTNTHEAPSRKPGRPAACEGFGVNKAWSLAEMGEATWVEMVEILNVISRRMVYMSGETGNQKRRERP